MFCLGEENWKLQRAWRMLRRFLSRHPKGYDMTKMEFLDVALKDQSVDLLDEKTTVIMDLARELTGWEDDNLVDRFMKLLPELETNDGDVLLVPDYETICRVTGASKNNASLKSHLWYMADGYMKWKAKKFLDR